MLIELCMYWVKVTFNNQARCKGRKVGEEHQNTCVFSSTFSLYLLPPSLAISSNQTDIHWADFMFWGPPRYPSAAVVKSPCGSSLHSGAKHGEVHGGGILWLLHTGSYHNLSVNTDTNIHSSEGWSWSGRHLGPWVSVLDLIGAKFPF